MLTARKTAQVLASPVRRCHVTRTVVPRDLLQSFKLVAHPESGDPWWVPLDLSAVKTAELPVGSGGLEVPDIATKGPGVYTLARRDLLQRFVDASSKYNNGFRTFARASSSSRYAGAPNDAVWREDMDYHILELMRRRISDDLVYLSSLSQSRRPGYLIALDGPGQLAGYHQLGCIFIIDKEPMNASSFVDDFVRGESAADVASHWPSRGSGGVPMYDINRLLGDAHLDRLYAESPLFRGASAVLVRGIRTLGLQKRLWKLHAYDFQ